MTWDVVEVTAPTWEPATLEELRLWCRIDTDDTTQDAVLLLLITAARERAEALTGRAFARRTLEVALDRFPMSNAPIYLPYPPLVSVSYIRYRDAAGDLQELSGSPDSFLVDTASQPGRIQPLANTDWPDVQDRINAVTIGFVCGHNNINAVPKRLRLWLQSRVSTWYENREHLLPGNVKDAPRDFVDGILDELRAVNFFA